MRTLLLLGLLLGLTVTGCQRRSRPGSTVESTAVAVALQPVEILTELPPAELPAFELTEQHGQPFTLAHLKGKWSILFFGFTHCPDVCPTTLSRLKQIHQLLTPPIRERLQVVFISVDPERDTPSQMRTFLEHYDQSFVGATGRQPTLDQLTASLSAAYELPKDTTGAYSVMHSSALFLVNPEGKRVGLFSSSVSAEQIAAELTKRLL